MPLKKLIKRFSESRDQYGVKCLDDDAKRLSHASSAESISSGEGSLLGIDDASLFNNPDIRKKSQSEGILSRLTRKFHHKRFKHGHSECDLSQEKKTVRRCKSETEITDKTKSRRPSSLLKGVLCVITETESQESDVNEEEFRKEREPTTFYESYDSAMVTIEPKEGLKSKEDLRESVTACSNLAKKEQNHEEDRTSINDQFNVDDLRLGPEPKAITRYADLRQNESKIDWECTGARPKDISVRTDSGTSSGVWSSVDCLTPDQSERIELLRSKEPTSENTCMRSRYCASSPGNIPDCDERALNEQLDHKWNSYPNIHASNVQLNILDGETGHGRPIMAVNPQLPRDDTERLQAKSDVVMKTFGTEVTVAHRKAFQKGIQALTSKGKSRVSVIVGHKGDGKTVCGRYLLQNAKGFKHRLLVGSCKEWQQSIRITEADDPDTVVFIDDMFGTDRFQKSIFYKWRPILDEIYSSCTMGNVSAIISMDKKVYDCYISQQNCHSLFSEAYITDLTGEYELKFDEKCNIVKQHLRAYKKAKEVRLCKEKEEDNTAEFAENDVLIIWEETIKQIAIVSFPVGFPRAAAVFASSIEYIKQGVEYFFNPQKSIIVAINEMRRSQDTCHKKASFALGMLLNSGGKLNLSKIEEEENVIDSVKRNSNVKTKNPFTETLRKSVPANEQITVYLREGIDELKGSYVEIEDDKVSFRCDAIFYSAAISFGKQFAGNIIQVMPLDFVTKFVGPTIIFSGRDALYISVDRSTFPSLASRLLKEIGKRNVKLIMEHPYMGDKGFVSFLLKYATGECKMKHLLLTTDKETNLNVLCHGMVRSYKANAEYANFTEQILRTKLWKDHMKKKATLKEYFEKEAVKIAANEGRLSSFEVLVKEMKTIDEKCFDSIIKSGSKQLLDILLKYQTYRINLCNALRATCNYHYRENRRIAVKFGKHLLSKESSLMVKKAMRETRKLASNEDDNDLLELLQMIEEY